MRRYFTKLSPLNMRQTLCLRFTNYTWRYCVVLFCPLSNLRVAKELPFSHNAWTPKNASYMNGLGRRTFHFSFTHHTFHLYICSSSFWIDSSLSFLWAGSLFSFHQTLPISLPFSVRTPPKSFNRFN